MSRFFQSFTIKLAIFILSIAFLSAVTMYDKEVSSVVRMYANGGGGVTYVLTEREAAHFRESSYWYFVIFSLPLIPLFTCAGRKPAQVAIAILSVVVLVLAISVSPGGDRKGCEECLGPILLSGASTILVSVLAMLWIALTSIFKFVSGRAKSESTEQ